MPTIPARRNRVPAPGGPAAHAGLILNRYLAAQSDNGDEKNGIVGELFTAARAGVKAVRPLYELAFKRWVESHPAGCASFDVKTDGRVIVGLGGHHVLETGLTLHHTYGVPCIPGTALKGLAAHYCHAVCGESNPDFRGGETPGELFTFLFGSQTQRGAVRFHDAWLRPESLLPDCLHDDVMTPHHGDYAMAPSDPPPPSDFDNPVPVAFLSVTGTFRVVLSLHSGFDDRDNQADAWRDCCGKLVREALAEWGVGGKTSSGYGRFVDVG